MSVVVYAIVGIVCLVLLLWIIDFTRCKISGECTEHWWRFNKDEETSTPEEEEYRSQLKQQIKNRISNYMSASGRKKQPPKCPNGTIQAPCVKSAACPNGYFCKTKTSPPPRVTAPPPRVTAPPPRVTAPPPRVTSPPPEEIKHSHSCNGNDPLVPCDGEDCPMGEICRGPEGLYQPLMNVKKLCYGDDQIFACDISRECPTGQLCKGQSGIYQPIMNVKPPENISKYAPFIRRAWPR